jgi:4'-phosphopantetheinyl transferase
MLSSRSSSLQLSESTSELAGERPQLKEREVHVWKASLPKRRNALDQLEQLLDQEEIRRARRFRNRNHGAAFIARRGLLRTILSCYLGLEPRDLAFSMRCQHCGKSHGKPRIADERVSRGIRFSISHSSSLIVYAIIRGAEVGIDVERVWPEFPWHEVSELVLTPAEEQIILQQTAQRRAELFFRIWTRKEALVKLHGDGLVAPLACIDVTRYLKRRTENIEDLLLGPNYVGALALESPYDITGVEMQENERGWTPVSVDHTLRGSVRGEEAITLTKGGQMDS